MLIERLCYLNLHVFSLLYCANRSNVLFPRSETLICWTVEEYPTNPSAFCCSNFNIKILFSSNMLKHMKYRYIFKTVSTAFWSPYTYNNLEENHIQYLPRSVRLTSRNRLAIFIFIFPLFGDNISYPKFGATRKEIKQYWIVHWSKLL